MREDEKLRKGLGPQSVEDFLIEKLNAKYAQRIFQKLNTEWERLIIEGKTEPGYKEYEWMVKRALELHRDTLSKKVDSNEEETTN